jgi:hypothetical protein
MSSPRTHGLSARVDEETYTALCARAKAQGLTLSSLVAQCLATGSKAGPPPVETEPQEESSSVTATGLDRIVNLERWVQFFLSFLIEKDAALFQRYDLLCPSCGERELGYVESGPGLDGTPPVRGFVCTHCEWEVTDHASYTDGCPEPEAEPENASRTGQDPASSPPQ